MFLLTCHLLQVSELSSQLEDKQQEVSSLQQSLTTAKQLKDTMEQELGGLVSSVAYCSDAYEFPLQILVQCSHYCITLFNLFQYGL